MSVSSQQYFIIVLYFVASLLIKAGWNLMQWFMVENGCSCYPSYLGQRLLFPIHSLHSVDLDGSEESCCLYRWNVYLATDSWWECQQNYVSCVCVYVSFLWVSSKVQATAVVQGNIGMLWQAKFWKKSKVKSWKIEFVILSILVLNIFHFSIIRSKI